MLKGFFYDIIFGIIKVFASIVDTIVNLMRGLLGLGDNYTGDITLSAITSEAITLAFWIVVALGFATTFIFAIIRIIKNYFADDKDDGAISKHKAIKQIFLSVINMLILPVFCIALILGTTATAKVVDSATHNSYNPDYGIELIFSVVSEDDLKEKGITIATNGVYVLQEQWKEKDAGKTNVNVEHLETITGINAVKYILSSGIYYDSTGNLQSGSFDTNGFYIDNEGYGAIWSYVDKDNYFDNWLLPLLGGAVMVVSFAMSIIIVAQRVYYIAFMFVISPFIVSTRPLDDGARWNKWCEVFISKLIGAFAIVVCLNVFFLVAPTVINIQFFAPSNTLANGISKLIIYIAGVLAATGASQLVAQLIGGDAGQVERDNAQQNFRALAGGGALAGTLAKGAKSVGNTASNFFAGKKETPTNAKTFGANMMGADGGKATADNSLVGDGMAGKIGNTLMGKNTVKDVAKAGISKAKNSRLAQIGKGIGAFVGGLALAPIRLGVGMKNLGQKIYAKRHPNSKTAQKVAERKRMNDIKKNTTPHQRENYNKVAKQMKKTAKK